MCRLYLSLMNRMSNQQKSFGDASEPLAEL